MRKRSWQHTGRVGGVAIASLLLLAGSSLPIEGARAGFLERLFAPKAETWEKWTRHQPGSGPAVDHSEWSRFLAVYVARGDDGVNRVAYAEVSANDRRALAAYLDRLQAVPILQYDRDQQFAFWVNLYNALTVQVVLQHYPVDSIRSIKLSKGLFASGPWNAKLATVEGESLTLNDIEHRILRPIWRDPRIHYAVNCASLGCPNLTADAFTADNLEKMLDRAAREYVNHPRGARLRGDRLYVSSLYEWFQDDFGGSDAALIRHLAHYADEPLASALRGVTRISGDSYDWSLNDAAG